MRFSLAAEGFDVRRTVSPRCAAENVSCACQSVLAHAPVVLVSINIAAVAIEVPCESDSLAAGQASAVGKSVASLGSEDPCVARLDPMLLSVREFAGSNTLLDANVLVMKPTIERIGIGDGRHCEHGNERSWREERFDIHFIFPI